MSLVDLLSFLLDRWREAKARDEGRQEIIKEQAKADASASAEAQTVRDRVGRMSDRELDDGLRQFTRPS